MNRKIISILLFFSLVVPVFIMTGFIHIQKIRIRKEVELKIGAGLQKENLTLLKFGKNEIKQLKRKDSDEFEFNKQMYDVVKKETTGDSVYYWCYADNKETKLNRLFIKLVSIATRNNDQNKEMAKNLLLFIKSLFYSDTPNIKIYPHPAKLLFFPFATERLTVLNPPPAPPPRILN